MNKKLRNLFLCLLLCFTVFFAGCGLKPEGQLDTKAKLNLGSAEDYSIATTEDKQFLSTYIQENTLEEEATTYRITLTMEMGGLDPDGEVVSTVMNGIIAPTQDGINLGMKVEVNENGVKSEINMFFEK